MPAQFFKIPLSVEPKGGGEAKLVTPKILQDLSYRFVLVKDGGTEGIIQLEESEEILAKIAKNKTCQKLPPQQLEKLKNSYPKPKLKQKYRLRVQSREEEETEASTDEIYEVDEQGNRIIDTFQTVRSGFYLIDVQVFPNLG